MCAIIGVSGKFDKDILNKIFKYSRIRGLHAFGFTYVNDNKIITKKYLDYNEFCQSIFDLNPNKFIAHFRYSTSGDWKEIKNNQPIEFYDHSLVFNGVIDMRTKDEMEKHWGYKLNTENDGEIALNEYKNGNIYNLLRNNDITFAGLIINKNNEIIAIKNKSRPLHQAKLNDCNYIASTEDILKRSGLKNIEELKPYGEYKY